MIFNILENTTLESNLRMRIFKKELVQIIKNKICYLVIFELISRYSYGFFQNEIELKKQGFQAIEEEQAKLKGDIYLSIQKLNKEYKLDIEALYSLNEVGIYLKSFTNYSELLVKKEIIFYFEEDKRKKVLVKEIEDGEKFIKLEGLPKNLKNIYYKLRVYDKNNNYDETKFKKLKYVKDINIQKEEEIEKLLFDNSSLKEKNIFSNVSKVKFYGKNFKENEKIVLKDKEVTINAKGEFLLDELLENGKYDFEFLVYEDDIYKYSLNKKFEVNGHEIFLIGMADFTLSKGKISGNDSQVKNEDFYSDDLLTEGRLAFYTKNDFSKYNVTAYLDTENQKIDKIFKGLGERDNREIFKSLSENDKGYTFGDDSTIVSDVDTQGKFYLKVDWEKNKLLWGNYTGEIEHGEFLKYSKSLYGAQVYLETLEKTKFHDSREKGSLFFSNPDVGSSYNIFLATGGSLFYLKNKDLVRGSENLKIEVKNLKTGRVLKEISLSEGDDYQINPYQGRIILNKPLYQYGYADLDTQFANVDLKDVKTYLKVTYDYYNPTFLYDEGTIVGGDYSKWVNDNWKIGVASVESSEKDEKYNLKGVSQTLKLSNNTYIDMEYAESSGKKSGKGYFSTSGGLAFEEINSILDIDSQSPVKGRAYKFSGNIDLNELNSNIQPGSLMEFWYSKKDGGFAVESLSDGTGEEKYGVNSNFNLNSKTNLSLQYSLIQDESKEESYATFLNYKLRENLNFEIGLVQDIQDSSSDDEFGGSESENLKELNLKTKVYYEVNESLSTYAGINKNDLENDGSLSYLLGTDIKINENLKVGFDGEKGDENQIFATRINYSPFENYETYLNFENEKGMDENSQNMTFGQKSILNEKYEFFQESRTEKSLDSSEISDAYGLNINLRENLTLSFVYEEGELFQEDGNTKRRSASVGVDYRKNKDLKMSSRFEYLEDKSDERTIVELLTTNNYQYKLNNEITLASRLDLGIGVDRSTDRVVKKLVDVTFGAAYRPIWNDKFNFLGKYNFVYDKNSDDETDYDFNNLDEKMRIFSIDGIYSVNKKLDISGKYALKIAEMKAASDESEWYKSQTELYAVGFDYKFYKNWSFEFEHHWLMSKSDNQMKSGVIVTLNNMVNENLKVGGGYNFTDFSDNLKYENYNAQGFFLNITGIF